MSRAARLEADMTSMYAVLDIESARFSETVLARRLAASANTVRTPVDELAAWLEQRRVHSPYRVVEVPFADLTGWHFAEGSGDLVHETGRFFSVEGIEVQTDFGDLPRWSQPIIHQPERAVLGILAKEFDGVLHFLMQAKMEPGNRNGVQLSPTVQATPSNYLRAHKGAASRYIEYFLEPGHAHVLVDSLQSEQGSWFRGKRNRNIVMETTRDVAEHGDFRWLTLGEILGLLRLPNVVNMDARTVLSCLPLTPDGTRAGADEFGDALARSASSGDRAALHPLVEVKSWLTGRKAGYSLLTNRLGLDEVPGWHRDAWRVSHHSGRYFCVLGVQVQASNREVRSWAQPLLAPVGIGLVAFVVRRIGGVVHVLARADLRPGYRDVVELGPTVQCTPGNFADAPERLPELAGFVTSADVLVRYDMLQSEEGGRFHHAVTRHLIVETRDDPPLRRPADFKWLTVAQLMALIDGSYQVNIEARSLSLCLNTLYGQQTPGVRT
jgi:oxidase EvaA